MSGILPRAVVNACAGEISLVSLDFWLGFGFQIMNTWVVSDFEDWLWHFKVLHVHVIHVLSFPKEFGLEALCIEVKATL